MLLRLQPGGGGRQGKQGPSLRARPDLASADVAARDGPRGHVVADEAVGGGGAEAGRFGRGRATAVEGTASVEVATPTTLNDVAAY